jgi:hypothetical protein
MKYSMLVCGSFIILSCSKVNHNLFEIKGKLVVQSCQVDVVEILDPKYYGLSQEKWTSSLTGETFDHVFGIANYCNFQLPELNRPFYFKLITNDPPNSCPICTSINVPPQSVQHIKFLSYTP